MTRVEALWTINELRAQVERALSVDYAGPPNGRIRDIPDERTIRYYTTLGLMDRPAELRGRTALYGRRHLLQLVAIKRLQARGLSLSAIQQQLLGLGEAALRRLARLPEAVEPAEVSEPALPPPTPAHQERFWTRTPALPCGPGRNGEEGEAKGQIASPSGAAAPAVLHGIRLEDEVMLLFASARPVDDDDLQAIRNVAAPLVTLLKRRRLVGQSKQKESS